ncbi:hydroxymethylpyrimidine/phosphomethylpyrimidine kinase [Desulfonispora thiosulfatigenes DSM 11270]|uniref:Hydroxymethylpyrimidine/phosphomethylpyrimidine kinase n=1 Tax=Desulfonispora thiosulfatigenes DSM 11270 TaxID=656914 RepID=A0A1W1V419_DESTI|nr:bifunctional hydroxymethylpyrimidine kinase/phosphomethylpyrimidine kinase [Desulfonispora thiosulfatigenes]SMB88003.1 hydroxymethylpyrimidine/phosphomethylpyrimidine kinase [Desulfonispora thiosulfatigenes DSM 11270]
MKTALTIAGSDCSGGAGIQADLKTFSAHGVFGMSVITAITAQNTQGVSAVENLSAEMVSKQIEAIFTDIEVDAVKIGMVSETKIIKTIAENLKKYQAQNVVVDPVMISKSGFDLLQPEAKEALISHLLPLAEVVTPNIPEAEVIVGMKIDTVEDMEKAALLIHKMGPKKVLVKGGHLTEDAIDVLYDGKKITHYTSERINTKNTHGTGCTLSSAITANLAKGANVEEGVREAKEYITTAIRHSLALGKGYGPTNHFYSLYQKAGMLD